MPRELLFVRIWRLAWILSDIYCTSYSPLYWWSWSWTKLQGDDVTTQDQCCPHTIHAYLIASYKLGRRWCDTTSLHTGRGNGSSVAFMWRRSALT